jgi:RNA polymerase sigma factor (sigma-70 family)
MENSHPTKEDVDKFFSNLNIGRINGKFSRSKLQPFLEREDIAQTTYLRAATSIENKPIENLTKWIYSIGRNYVSAEGKRNERWKRKEIRNENIESTCEDTFDKIIIKNSKINLPDHTHEGDKTIIEDVSNIETIFILGRELNELNSNQRDYILLKHFDGYSYKEIMNQYDVNLNAVKKGIHNGLKKLRTSLRKKGISLNNFL